MAFNGERLKTARIFRGMSISELAEQIGVTRQAISQYEKNQTTPKAEMLFQIVTLLKFPLAFFTENEANFKAHTENTFFRALASAKTLDLETQKIKTSLIIDIYSFLSRYLNLPELKLPQKDFSYESPEEAAEILRASWNLGSNPVPNMVGLLEKNGIIVSSLRTDTSNIDAFTQVRLENGEKKFCVVLGNDKQSMVRRNFDAAHELGHILMHRDYPDVAELDKDEFKAMESEANQFAAAFLLPRDSFFFDLKDPTKLDAYIELKKKWKVSIAAMIMRARQIGRISPLQYQNLMKQLSFRQWRKAEPLDDVWQTARPQLFRQSIRIIIQNEILSPSEIVSELGKYGYYMNPDVIENLIDLEEGALTEPELPEDMSLVLSIRRP